MKYFFFTFLILCQVSNAWQTDTTYYSMKSGEAKMSTPENADYFEVYNDNGAKNGVVHQYYLDGEKRASITYKKGIAHGAYKVFYKNGVVKESGRFSSGIPISLKRAFYDNGDPKSQSMYSVLDSTLQHKMLNIWDNSGELMISNGNGEFKEFDENDQPLIQGNYTNGLKTGDWVYYKKTTNKNRIEKYDESGELIHVREEELQPIEVQASFPGGTKAWSLYLRKNLKYPREGTRGGYEGRVFISFMVDVDGSISKIKAVKSPHVSLSTEAVRVLQNSPNWLPATLRGEPVKNQISIQILFKLK
jgi:TonB family protein